MTKERTIAPPPGTIIVWSDIACPWGSLAVHRLHAARTRLGLDDAVRLDHRAFALEIVNERSTPKLTLDAEIAAIGAHDPTLEWQLWARRVDEYPSTALLALAAVQAAKSDAVGGLRASEQLDLALRRAFFVDSRPISLWTEILDAARSCPDLDAAALADVLRRGAHIGTVLDQVAFAQGSDVDGSPHLFLPDGTDVHNPGITMSWTKEPGRGFPVIEADDPTVYDDVLRRAAA